jgi:hypothetical protein
VSRASISHSTPPCHTPPPSLTDHHHHDERGACTLHVSLFIVLQAPLPPRSHVNVRSHSDAGPPMWHSDGAEARQRPASFVVRSPTGEAREGHLFPGSASPSRSLSVRSPFSPDAEPMQLSTWRDTVPIEVRPVQWPRCTALIASRRHEIATLSPLSFLATPVSTHVTARPHQFTSFTHSHLTCLKNVAVLSRSRISASIRDDPFVRLCCSIPCVWCVRRVACFLCVRPVTCRCMRQQARLSDSGRMRSTSLSRRSLPFVTISTCCCHSAWLSTHALAFALTRLWVPSRAVSSHWHLLRLPHPTL